ncbi:MAG: cyclase family protein [Acidimicrobiales bacterium]
MMNKRFKKRALVAGSLAFAVLVTAGAVTALGGPITIKGSGAYKAGALSCPGGMVRLGHVFDENASVFPGDPVPEITTLATIEQDFFLLESVKTGTHTGTHLGVPGHFIAGGATVDDLAAESFVWPTYVIDVRSRVAANADFQLTRQEIKNYEAKNGNIRAGSLVVLFTGFQAKYGTPTYATDTAPGFSADAVNYMFATRRIKGVGSDTFGPDASSDADFAASTAVYSAGGITLENMRGLDQLHVTGDIVMAPTVALRDGSGYQTDPIACRRS